MSDIRDLSSIEPDETISDYFIEPDGWDPIRNTFLQRLRENPLKGLRVSPQDDAFRTAIQTSRDELITINQELKGELQDIELVEGKQTRWTENFNDIALLIYENLAKSTDQFISERIGDPSKVKKEILTAWRSTNSLSRSLHGYRESLLIQPPPTVVHTPPSEGDQNDKKEAETDKGGQNDTPPTPAGSSKGSGEEKSEVPTSPPLSLLHEGYKGKIQKFFGSKVSEENGQAGASVSQATKNWEEYMHKTEKDIAARLDRQRIREEGGYVSSTSGVDVE